MYYLAKIAQATGLAVIAIGVIARFPELMDMRVFGFGLAVFTFGWFIQIFLLKK